MLYEVKSASLTPKGVVTYKQCSNHLGKIIANIGNRENLKNNKHNGFLSNNSARKMKQCIDWFIFSSYYSGDNKKIKYSNTKNRLVFATLTLPMDQQHSDNFIKSNCLDVLLKWLTYNYNVKNYVWRAEKQLNGRIHFHLLIDKYIYWKDLRDKWNGILANYGYILRFWRKHGHTEPNSTDIHQVYSKSNVYSYICKYVAKKVDIEKLKSEGQYEKMAVDGRLWYASTSLSRIKAITFTEHDYIWGLVGSLIDAKKDKYIVFDYANGIYGDLLYRCINKKGGQYDEFRKEIYENIEEVVNSYG